eukprot:TRINITY_DN30990_c0_g1_i1.p1 TRINITY_DN30990_c0_g1~~TRINITY_DN30990_c0_g1_i1.p1  ORF type:complete len:268 (+),score=53.74 TRINITY_DN30990_c0_g1_i1:36-839(+)
MAEPQQEQTEETQSLQDRVVQLEGHVVLLQSCLLKVVSEMARLGVDLTQSDEIKQLLSVATVDSSAKEPDVYTDPLYGEVRRLRFVKPGDRGGLIYLIATNHGAQEWQNPLEAKLVKVEASSVKSGELRDVVACEAKEQVFFTNNEKNSWVQVDLGAYRLKPSNYTLAHCPTLAMEDIGFFMRNWDLQGSADGQKWVVLSTHRNDTTLSPEQLTAAWTVEGATEFYRFFRIQMHQSGNSKGTGSIVLCCLELYGEWAFEVIHMVPSN